MLNLPTHVRVFASNAPTDMRKSFAGLVGLVEKELGRQVEAGGLFLFFSRRRNAVKVLFFTGDGLAIFYRRLERGTFEAPQASNADAKEIWGAEGFPDRSGAYSGGVMRDSNCAGLR